MKIDKVEAIPLAIPYRRPFGFASGRVTAADHVLVRITTDDGLVGHGEAPPRPYTYGETASSIVAAVRDLFGPVLVGADPFARERIRADLDRTVANNAAKGAVDVALWDLVGQACGQPVHVLLGHAADDVRAAHMIGLGTPAEMVADAVEVRDDHGVDAFKIKVGRELDVDMAAVRALRTELGDGVELYADANRGWDADTAIVASRRLADHGVSMLEEPNPAADVLGRRRIVAASPIPVVGDESTITLGGVARSLLDGDSEAISVKVARTGFTDSAKIVGLCEGLGRDHRRREPDRRDARHGRLGGARLRAAGAGPPPGRGHELPAHDRRRARRAAGDRGRAPRRPAGTRPRGDDRSRQAGALSRRLRCQESLVPDTECPESVVDHRSDRAVPRPHGRPPAPRHAAETSPTTSARGRRPAPTRSSAPASGRSCGGSWAGTRTSAASTSTPGDELHELLSSLPLFPYMEVEVTALTRHPSKLDQ